MVRQDGRSASLAAPNGRAQQLLLSAVLADACTTATELQLVEAAANGSAMGDAIESGAIAGSLLASRARSAALPVGSVKAVVVDEVHDLAASERGWQLSVGLSRLDHMCGRRVQRIGLSATVGNPVDVAEWLAPGRGQAMVAVAPRETELTVESEPPEAQDEIGAVEQALSTRAHATFRRLIRQVEQTPQALVFVNSRSDAETVGQRLQHMAPHLRIGVHHGSLAQDTRQAMEDQLRSGDLDALVCTSSLELGIDVGSVQRVIQVNSPRSVDRMLQRVGRADHRLGGLGRGHLLVWDVDELSEAAVTARRAMEAAIEPVTWRARPWSIAANQLVLMAHAHKAVPLHEATAIFADVPQFDGWSHDDTLNVLRVLEDGWLVRVVEDPSKGGFLDKLRLVVVALCSAPALATAAGAVCHEQHFHFK